MENKMKERNWKYKITGNWTAVIAVAITTAVFGGVAFWCRTAGNQGGLVGFGGLTAFFAIVCIRLIYAELSFRLLVDESGFYFRTTLRDGRYYRYREVRSMWLATDGMTDLQQATYCNFETMDGKRSRFLVLDPQLDAVDYMIERVEAVGDSREEDDRDREFVIPGKKKVGGLMIFAVLLLPVLYLILFVWTSMPLILRIIPVAVVLIPVVKVFFLRAVFQANDPEGRLLLPHQPLRRAVLPLRRHSGLLSRGGGAGYAQTRNILRLLHEIH